jgi:dipeptidyl aminopeptidase/acylaminoacyl peptidase
MSYGSVSWSYKGYENTVLTLISGDYRIYQMPMDTRKLIEIDNIYKQTREKDIFLPIFNFEYSDYANKAVINVARPTYVNSYIFDFRKYQYKEVTEFFDRKVFTARSFMNTTKTKIIAQSLNAENEKDDLILVNLRNYKTEKLLTNCKIDNIEISPSDRNILITGNMDAESDEDISKPYIYNLMNKELIPLPFIADWNSFSWDLDEEKIYYIVNNKDLYQYNVVNNKNRKIFSSDLYIYNMSIGRDMIAFSYLYPDTGKNILILYNTQTKKSQIIDEVYDGVIRSGFSPNSDFLFYEVVNHEDFKDLYLLKIN